MTKLGNFVGDYGVAAGSPTETYSNNGAEASVQYLGPSATRFDFLQSIFPVWRIHPVVVCSKEYCCAELVSPPCPYPDPTVIVGPGDCSGPRCLWPERFTAKPTGTSRPALFNCAGDDCNKPIIDDCTSEVEIQYRWRYHGEVPGIFQNCTTTNWGTPPVPIGTYVDMRLSHESGVAEIDARGWEFRQAGTFGGFTFAKCPDCDESTAKLPPDAHIVQQTHRINLELTWDQVPLPPWHIWNLAHGRVNAGPFLGYPAGSVVFTVGEPEIVGAFGCIPLYRVRLNFSIWMAGIENDVTPVVTGNELDTITVESSGVITNGKIGLWNRVWSPCPIKMTFGAETYCTHWVPVQDRIRTCCGPGSSYGQPPYGYFPMEWLFAQNESALVPENTEFGTVRVPMLTDLAVLPISIDIPGVSKTTFDSYLAALAYINNPATTLVPSNFTTYTCA